MTDIEVESPNTSEGTLEKNEGATFIKSLQDLTSSMPPVENVVVKNKKPVKKNLKRGRKKKKLPVKFPQPTILPKIFTIQIAPHANIIAPVSTVLNQNTLQNVAAKSQDPCGYQPPVTNITQVPAASNKEQNLCSSKTTSEPKTKQITKEESIKLAGTFQYATNNSEPAQFSLEDVTVGSQGFQKVNHKRLIHNLSEKRRKEKINGWITKIASVLFKHCPEKQPKIYILEKAYEFITKRTQSPERRDGKQDAFTQADPAQDEKLSDLVMKVIELENLLHSLLKVIKRCKIPVSPILFKSPYVKKLAAAHLSDGNTIESALTLVTSTGSSFVPTGSSTGINSHSQNGAKPHPGAENGLYPVRTSMESVPQTQLQQCLPTGKQPVSAVDSSSNCTPATQINPNSSSVEYDLDVVSSSVVARGNMLQVPNASSYAASNGIPSVTAEQRSVGVNIASSELLSSSLQPSLLTSQAGVLPVQQVNNVDAANFLPSQSNLVSVAPKSVDSIPQCFLNSNMIGFPSDVINGNIEKQVVLSCNDAASINTANKQLQINKETAVKPPSMESQMFVMKNLVHSRTKANLSNFDLLANIPVSSNRSNAKPAKNGSKKDGNTEVRGLLEQSATAKVCQASRGSAVIVDKRMLRSDAGFDSKSTEASFVRIESQLLEASQPTQEISVNNVGGATVCSQIATSGDASTTQSKQRPSKPSKLLLNVGLINETNADAISKPPRASSVQAGPSGIQTCHSVTSLLSNMTTSPTENSALSIDRILSDKPGSRQESCPMKLSEQTMQPFVKGLNNQTTSKSNVVPRKRSSSNRAPRKQSNIQATNSLQISLNHGDINSSKPSPKRAKKSLSQPVSQSVGDMQMHRPVSQQILSPDASNQMVVNNKGKKEDRSKQRRPNHVKGSGGLNLPQGGNMLSLPKPHNFVSLARKDQRNKTGTNALSQFSTESLLRSSNAASTQALVGDTDQDISLPTILNIFAPASIGNMVNQLPMSTNLSNPQIVNNNSNFPTIHSTFSNFSAEALIGGQMDNQSSVSTVMNATPTVNDHPLNQSEQQSLFTDFSTDALLAGTESSLSYGIDSIMSRNDVVVSNSCISPNWLQTNSLIDNSPIRGSFNHGLNIFDTPGSLQGYVTSGQNAVFTTPIKWRQDAGRNDDQNINLTPSSSASALGLWGQNLPTSAQKNQRIVQSKDVANQKPKGTRGQSSSKRGPSFGDFLLVDSVS